MSTKIRKAILLVELIALGVIIVFLAGLITNDWSISKSAQISLEITPTIQRDINPIPSPELDSANKLVAENPVTVPDGKDPRGPTAYHCGPPEDWVVYQVKENDSLVTLIQRFELDLGTFQQANCLGDSQVIVASQTVFVPSAEEVSNADSLQPIEPEVVEHSKQPEIESANPVESNADTKESRLAQEAWVEVRPGSYPGYLENPGIGWQYYYSSARINSIPQTVTYGERDVMYWAKLNPGDGVYDWTLLDGQLNTAIARGEQFSFRIYTSADSHKIPQWVFTAGAQLLPNGDIDHQSCVYQEKWGKFVNALAARYDGNPNIAYIDISGYGDFNEWSWEGQTEWDYVWAENYESGSATSSTMSTMDSYARRRLADIFIGGAYSGHQCKNPDGSIRSLNYSYPGFQETQLVMPYAGIRQSTQYVFLKRKDVGFRHDCLGRESSNDMVTKLGNEIKGIWPNAPVVLETCVPSAFDFKAAQYQSGEMHASLFHNAKIDFTDNQIKTLAGYAGYRFRLLYAGYDGVVTPDGDMNLELGFRNVGSAPAYSKMGQTFSLHFYIAAQDNSVLEDFVIPVDISSWGPGLGSKSVARGSYISELLTVPGSLTPGTYKVLLGIINDRTNKPINLDVDIPAINGLYPLGEVVVSSP